jgi:glycosyl transferase family 25
MNLRKNIYIINLDTSIDRLQHVSRNFGYYNIEFNRFAAINGKNISEKERNENTSILCRTILCNYAEIGCALSHIELWRKMIREKIEYMIILEDDVVIDELFVKVIKIIENLNSFSFDFLSLYSENKFGKQKIYHLIDDIFIEKPLFALSMASYIISNKGAKRLLNLIPKINFPIDFEIAWKRFFYQIDYYCTSKNITKLNKKLESTIRHNKDSTIFMNLVKKTENEMLYQKLSAPLFTFIMKYPITPYLLLLLFLLIINLFYLKNYFLYFLIILELILYFF